MMLSNTQSLFNLFLALLTLQQATSALALPTRGSYGQLARRANAVKRAASPTTQTARARLARQKDAAAKRSEVASPVNSKEPHFATPSAHIIKVNPKLALKQAQVKLAESRNGTSVEKEDDEAKAANIGGGYSMFSANNGVPSSSSTAAAQPSSSSSWVSASNVTLPSGLSKRELVQAASSNTQKQQLKKRVVAHPGAPSATVKLDVIDNQHLKKRVGPHPGAPSATIKVNVIGGDVLQNFTIIQTKTATSTSIKPAQTSINVNIVHNGTGTTIGGDEEEDEDATLLTFTFTLPIDALITGDETVTLVPTGNDSYIPYVNGKEADSESNLKATCTVPVDDDVLIAVARGQTFYSACTSSNATTKRVRVKVDVNSASTSTTSTKDEKAKRQMVAFFEAPSVSTSSETTEEDRLEKRQMVAFFQSPSEEAKSFTRNEMLSDLWEDCLVGIDENCLEVPEL